MDDSEYFFSGTAKLIHRSNRRIDLKDNCIKKGKIVISPYQVSIAQCSDARILRAKEFRLSFAAVVIASAVDHRLRTADSCHFERAAATGLSTVPGHDIGIQIPIRRFDRRDGV